MVHALYVGSFDPITNGHLDIIRRAATLFEKLTIGIGVNPDKKYLFALDERMHFIREATLPLRNTSITAVHGLSVDYAYEQNIPVIVKGVRSSSDFEYEHTIHEASRTQQDIDTCILFAKPSLASISSSAVKELQRHQGFVHELVPMPVKAALEAKINKQHFLGITGESGAGKSTIADALVTELRTHGVKATNVDLDRIPHDIYSARSEPRYVAVREAIANTFGSHTLARDGSIDRAVLGKIVFDDPAALRTLNALLAQPILTRLRKHVSGVEGVILLNAALLAEGNLTHLCNNTVIHVTADEASRRRRLLERGYDPSQITNRISSQYTARTKQQTIQAAINNERYGVCQQLENSDGVAPNIVQLARDVRRRFSL
jgi:pantetheine-phosphate adenylyltransferase